MAYRKDNLMDDFLKFFILIFVLFVGGIFLKFKEQIEFYGRYFVIFVFVIAVIGIIYYIYSLINKEDKVYDFDNEPLVKPSLTVSKKIYPFRLRDSLMNNSEQDLFNILKKELGSEYDIFSKVRVEDFVSVKSQIILKTEYFGFRNRIKSRHVDFLVCDQRSKKPLLAIELDGGVHNKRKIKERDENLDLIYKNIGLKFIHVDVRKAGNYEIDLEEIKNILKNILK